MADLQRLAVGAGLVGAGLAELLDRRALGLDGADLSLQSGLLALQGPDLAFDSGVDGGARLAGNLADIDGADREGAVALRLDPDRGGVDARRQATQDDLRDALQKRRLAEAGDQGSVRVDGDAVDLRGELDLGGAGEARRENQGCGQSGLHHHAVPRQITRPRFARGISARRGRN